MQKGAAILPPSQYDIPGPERAHGNPTFQVTDPMKLLALFLVSLHAPADSTADALIAQRVEIVRTEYGVPHILADDLEAMGFALGWLQSEDHGDVTARNLVRARGDYARYVGHDSIDGDFVAKETYARAVETYHQLEPETRQVYEGFAAGLRHYVRLHPSEFPDWMEPDFTGVDAHAREIQTWSRGDAARFVRSLMADAGSGAGGAAAGSPDDAAGMHDATARTLDAAAEAQVDFALDGSNAWAFHSSRTTSGKAILLRNPHLTWGAGYYEAHVRVPGVVEFYGDFRIGGTFGIIGGFNRQLGWATTNNYPRYSQVYALAADPAQEDHYILDGRSHPVLERSVTVDFRTDAGGLDSETRTTRWTPYGPVIHETEEMIYVLKDPRDGEFRRGEQFLRMMRSESLSEWLDVMRMRAHPSSNFTYADAAGNIVHLYNARLPLLPHESTGDTAAVAHSQADIWSELVPVDDMPLYVNPEGGYVQQANDTPDYTNLNVPMDRDTMPANLPDRRLRLRSQLSLQLVHGDTKLSLEDMVELKHSPRMLMAERVLDDLLEAARASNRPGLSNAIQVLEDWDRTAAADSRGGLLFKTWARTYAEAVDTASFYRESWSAELPTETPVGIGDPEAAVSALGEVVEGMAAFGIPMDIPWGDVHRVIRGDVDEPVSGCSPTLGCFRALSYEETEDGRFAANRGDAWVFAVEFGDIPRAYSVLSYGQSPKEDSPHFADQAAMFARGEMKTIAWTDEDIERGAIRRYRPGG